MADELTIESLASAVRHGGSALENVPGLLRQVLRDDVWRDFTTRRGEHVQHKTWQSFVTTLPLKGLGTTVEMIDRIIGRDQELRDLIDRATQRPPSLHAVNNGDSTAEERPRGNGASAALRRLRKDAPELHAEVLAGALSPHAAMVRAGFRRRTVSIPIDDPDAVARALARHMAPDALRKLTERLARDA